MLDSLPTDQAFSQLIIAQLRSYQERCLEYYKTLVSRPQLDGTTARSLRRASALSERGDLCDLLKALSDSTDIDHEHLLEQVRSHTRNSSFIN